MSAITTTEFRHKSTRTPRAAVLVLTLLLALLASIGVTQPAAAATKLDLTIKVAGAEHQPGQAIVVSGYLKTSSGRALEGKTILIQTASGDGWSTIAKTTTVDRGHYRLYVRQSGDFKVRAYARAMGRDAEVRTDYLRATQVGGGQSIAKRADILAPWLKKPVDAKVRTGKSLGKTVKYQRFTHGMLVQAHSRVYNVTSKILTAYLKAGGPTGKLGYPTSDADCVMTTKKCIQSFKGGAIYYHAGSVTSAKTHVAYGSGVGAEIIAVAMSQVGYREPAWKTNKYTAWNGRKVAWCGVFLSWSAAAGKNESAIPQVDTFSKLVSAVKKRGTTSKPKVGALVFMTFNGGPAATHVGVVTKVHADGTVSTIEGNTVVGSDPKRVVAKKTRTPSQIRFYYVPGT
jgi:hypothetical protein